MSVHQSDGANEGFDPKRSLVRGKKGTSSIWRLSAKFCLENIYEFSSLRN